MAALLGTVVLSVASLFSLATSWNSFAAPRQFGARLGLSIGGADGLNEIRAQYGGFFLAVALAGGAALIGLIPLQAGLVVTATVFGGLFFGRLVSLGADRGAEPYGAMIRALYVIDFTGFAASLAALLAAGSP